MIPAWVDGTLHPRRQAGGSPARAAPQGGVGLRAGGRQGPDPAAGAGEVSHAGPLGEHLLHASPVGRRPGRPAPCGGCGKSWGSPAFTRPLPGPGGIPRRCRRRADRTRAGRHLRRRGAAGAQGRARTRTKWRRSAGSTSTTCGRGAALARTSSRPGCASTSTNTRTASSGRSSASSRRLTGFGKICAIFL